jgi:hypothetical protein
MTGETAPARGPRTIFIGLSEVAGIFSSLEAGLRSIGVGATFHNLSPNVLSYATGQPRSYEGLLGLRHAPTGSLRHRVWRSAVTANRVVRRVRAALLFLLAAVRYDAFVLGGHTTFLGGLDLWILRRLRKPVLVIFTGSDHRPAYLSGGAVRQHSGNTKALAAEVRKQRRRVATAERWASAIIALPASAQLHRKPFIDLLKIGIAFMPPEMSASYAASSPLPGPVRALHCPTDPIGKGTDEIRQAVHCCQERGIAISLREITGRPNREVLAAIQECDFVIDELYSDTPMARFATEAAFYGKPAIVGSYATAMYRAQEDEVMPPAAMCHPDDLEETICSLASDEMKRRELGASARAFMTDRWSNAAVAERVLTALEGRAPQDWYVNPRTIPYIHGWGIKESALRATIRRMIDERGIESLQLAKRGRPLALALELARTEPDRGEALEPSAV